MCFHLALVFCGIFVYIVLCCHSSVLLFWPSCGRGRSPDDDQPGLQNGRSTLSGNKAQQHAGVCVQMKSVDDGGGGRDGVGGFDGGECSFYIVVVDC